MPGRGRPLVARARLAAGAVAIAAGLGLYTLGVIEKLGGEDVASPDGGFQPQPWALTSLLRLRGDLWRATRHQTGP